MTQLTVKNESVQLAVATAKTIAMNKKGLIALASLGKRSLHEVTISTKTGKVIDELSDDTTKVWEVWGTGKESRNGDTPKMYLAFASNEGNEGLGAYLVATVYAQLGVNALRLAENLKKSGFHTIKTSGETAKVFQQLKDLMYYANRFNVNIDGSPIAPTVTAENVAENVASEPTKGKAKK